eukprot:scaffold98864_cov59-Phaeocystis_antarctica.AAC.5
MSAHRWGFMGSENAYKGGVFSPNTLFFYERARLRSPHTSSHMSGHRPATVRRAGRKRGARFESSEALAEQPAVARSAVELHRFCTRVSRAAALVRQHILTAWPGRVAQALRAGRARAPWSCSPCWGPLRDAQSWGTSYSSTTK